MTLQYEPGAFDGEDASEGYEFDQDSGFSNSIENIQTFTGPQMEPGEYWQISATLSLSTSPDNLVFLEVREDGNGDIIKRSVIEDFGYPQTELTLTIPTYVANGGFGAPASGSATPEIRVNNVSGSSFNYFVDLQALRLRDGIDQTQETQNGSTDAFDSGQL